MLTSCWGLTLWSGIEPWRASAPVSYRVAADKLHDARKELTGTAKEDQDTDHDVRRGDSPGVQTEAGDQKDAWQFCFSKIALSTLEIHLTGR